MPVNLTRALARAVDLFLALCLKVYTKVARWEVFLDAQAIGVLVTRTSLKLLFLCDPPIYRIDCY